MKKTTIAILAVLALFTNGLEAQVNVRDSAAQGYIINFNIGLQVPAGDLSKMYGPHMSAGIDFFYKTKSNWLVGGGLDYLFGTNVKNAEEVLSEFITDDGNIIGTSGDYVSVKPFMRGWAFQGKVGKIFPIIGPNRNSGFLVQLGIGYLQHKTKFDHNNNVFQLNSPYDKGYDQLHKGFLISQYLAFYYAGNRKTTNFTAGFHFMQGFTKNIRAYNYFNKSYDLESKVDLYFGIKASWFLPIYDKHAQKYYYD